MPSPCEFIHPVTYTGRQLVHVEWLSGVKPVSIMKYMYIINMCKAESFEGWLLPGGRTCHSAGRALVAQAIARFNSQ